MMRSSAGLGKSVDWILLKAREHGYEQMLAVLDFQRDWAL